MLPFQATVVLCVAGPSFVQVGEGRGATEVEDLRCCRTQIQMDPDASTLAPWDHS